MGQVGVTTLRWNGKAEDFYSQEECYHVAEVIQDEFQGVQGQMAWLASRSKETSDHLAHMEWELKSLWVAFQLEQKYLHHLIKEHLMPLQSPYPNACCQCPILGDFIASPIPASFRGLHSEVSFRHGSPPPLKSCSTPDSFISFWEELNAIVGSEVSPIKQEGLLLHEVEVADEEASEEVWEEVGSGGSGGSGVGGGEVS